jgi:two-component system, NarL family, response regulator DevR
LLDPVITKQLLDRMRHQNKVTVNDPFEHLTEQEIKVLRLLAEGKTNREIAEKIFLSEKTVRNYVSSILGKLHLANRTEAAAYAAMKNLISRN